MKKNILSQRNKNHPLLITIAGSQSAGKTTAFSYLKSRFPSIKFYPEINPYTIAGKNHLGGAYADKNIQKVIIKQGLKRLRVILVNHIPAACEETGVFAFAYAQDLVPKQELEKLKKEYLKLYQQLNPRIIFINTPPQISWARRRNKYQQRINRFLNQQQTLSLQQAKKIRKAMMEQYKTKIYQNYSNLINFYTSLPFKKLIINNSGLREKEFLKEMEKLFRKICR